MSSDFKMCCKSLQNGKFDLNLYKLEWLKLSVVKKVTTLPDNKAFKRMIFRLLSHEKTVR